MCEIFYSNRSFELPNTTNSMDNIFYIIIIVSIYVAKHIFLLALVLKRIFIYVKKLDNITKY